ncbi:MAG TPA: hypothetical protein VFA20_16180, partial [Myxococcaceae bacterium]|nr:hypothetical protein [Myxococcaceae bacterium]
MCRRLWVIVAAVSAGVLAGCGGEVPGQAKQDLKAGGVVHRSSFGREGLEGDIKYYRDRLAALEAEAKPDPEAISQVSDLVAHLESLLPKDEAITL